MVGDTFEACMKALNVLMSLLRELGFAINYNKLCGPSTRLIFLEILSDTDELVLELPGDKLNQLQYSLQCVFHKLKATKEELQSLCGILNWCCQTGPSILVGLHAYLQWDYSNGGQ